MSRVDARRDLDTSVQGLTRRVMLTFVGAAGMIVGAFIDWGGGVRGTRIEWRAFFSTEAVGGAEVGLTTSAGLVMVVLGLLALVGVAFRTGWLTRLAGAAGLLLLVLLVVTGYKVGQDIGFFALGFWISVAGSVIAFIGGFFGSRLAPVD